MILLIIGVGNWLASMENKWFKFYTLAAAVIFLSACGKGLSERGDDFDLAENYGKKILSDFLNENYSDLYLCRDSAFKELVTIDAFISSTRDRRKIFPVESANVFGLEKKHGVYFVKFKYTLDAGHRQGEDVLVVELLDEGFQCLDLGLREFFPFNGAIHRNSGTGTP